jgi:hypothetical protein
VLLGDTVSARQALERVGGQEAEGEQANIQLLERFTRDAQAAFSGKDYRKVFIFFFESGIIGTATKRSITQRHLT